MSDGRVFHTLDFLRGFAAIGVVMFHMQQAFAPVAAPGGYLAVDLFFMMSGVVLSHAYESRFRRGMGSIDFMRARLIRLYPLYFLATLLGIAVVVASMLGRNSQNWNSSSLIQSGMLALFFLPDLSARQTDPMFPLNVPSWSLFLEILVNFLFVAFWPLLSSRRLLVISLLAAIGVGSAILYAGTADQGATFSGFAVGLARTVFGFSAGVLIARHFPRGSRVQSNLGVVAILAVVGIAIGGWPQGAWRTTWDAVCVLLVFPLVVYFGTLVDPGPRLARLATFLGLTSYAIYVFHSPLSSILNSAVRYLAAGNYWTGPPVLGGFVLAALLAGGWLVDRLFDIPLRRYLSHVIPTKRTRGLQG